MTGAAREFKPGGPERYSGSGNSPLTGIEISIKINEYRSYCRRVARSESLRWIKKA
jgi:hypothetical protein